MSKDLKELKDAISSLEQTAEGQLKGGFAVVGGGVSPQDTNGGCNNIGCNGGCGQTNTGTCSNTSCNNGCTPITSPTSGGQINPVSLSFSV